MFFCLYDCFLFYFVLHLPVIFHRCSHLCTCWNCASSNSRKSNPSEKRSTIESNLKMTNSCNQQFFFLFFFLPIKFPFSSIRHFILYTNLETFSYLPLMFLSNYINMEERKKLALFMCIAIFLSLCLSFFFFQFCRFYLILISLSLYVCKWKRQNERRKKNSWQITLLSPLNFISMRLQNRITNNKIEHVDIFFFFFFFIIFMRLTFIDK